MSDLDRLLESSDSEVARLLLRAGHEGAPPAAKQRALAAATGVIAASTLTAGNATGAVFAGKAAVGAKAATLLSLKWIVVIGVASVGVAAGTVTVHVVRAERASSASVAPAAHATAGSHASRVSSSVRAPPLEATVAPASTSDSLAPPESVAPSASVASPTPAAARASTPSVKSGHSTRSTSSAELAMLDQARSAMDRHDAAGALTILDAYASRFPRGVMAPEASILRIEALVSSGDRAAATRVGDAFLRANPASPYAARVQSLLGAPNP